MDASIPNEAAIADAAGSRVFPLLPAAFDGPLEPLEAFPDFESDPNKPQPDMLIWSPQEMSKFKVISKFQCFVLTCIEKNYSGISSATSPGRWTLPQREVSSDLKPFVHSFQWSAPTERLNC
jgi:hypothetical protein